MTIIADENRAKDNFQLPAFAFGLSASNMKKSLNHLDSPVKGISGVDGGPQNCHGATMDHTYIQVTNNWKKKLFVRLKKGVQRHMH